MHNLKNVITRHEERHNERVRQMMHLVMEVFKIYALLTMILFLVNISVLEVLARALQREAHIIT